MQEVETEEIYRDHIAWRWSVRRDSVFTWRRWGDEEESLRGILSHGCQWSERNYNLGKWGNSVAWTIIVKLSPYRLCLARYGNTVMQERPQSQQERQLDGGPDATGLQRYKPSGYRIPSLQNSPKKKFLIVGERKIYVSLLGRRKDFLWRDIRVEI